MKEISVSFTQDQLLLYELSLSIGKSLDPQTTSHDFLKTLFSRKNLVEAAIWWQDADDGLILLDALPADPLREKRLPAAHPYGHVIRSGTSRFLVAGDIEFAEFSTTTGRAAPFEACVLLPLHHQGLLVIHAPSSVAIPLLRTSPINEIIDRLATAIQGSLAHAQLHQIELASRIKTQSHPHSSPPIGADNDPSLLHALIQALPDLVWLKDPEGQYLACNNRFERFFGAPEEAIMGRTDYDFVDKDLADFFRQNDRQAIESGGATINEEWISFADDHHTELLETTKTPMYDAKGQLIGVLGIAHDITERKQTEERLRSEEERSRHLASMLRLMCDNVPDMIWAKDLNKNYLFANKAVCNHLLIAHDVKEPLGKSDLFFALRERERHADHPEWHTFGELCQESDAITLERGVPSVFIEHGNVKGKFLCLEVYKSPFFNTDGKIIGTVGCARDITDRRRIEAELEQHRQNLEELVKQRTSALLETEMRASSILQSTADGLYGIDLEGKVTFINPAACHMLGYETENVIGQSVHALFHHHRPDGQPYPAEECPTLQALNKGKELRSNNVIYWRADGSAIPVMQALHPTYQNGEKTGAVISFVNMTEQRAAEKAREQALITAENLARVKSQFLANMSHEIRTPLNGILGFGQIGLRHADNIIKTRNAFEKIIASGNRLLSVVNDILDFSKIEAGKLNVARSTVVLNEIIDHAVETVIDKAQTKKLSLVIEKSATLPLICMGDGLRLEQVLINLLSNAIKFTETGQIQLSVWREDDWLGFRVTDTGIGIREEDITHIFNPFHQGDNTLTRRFDGTGLGLAISKHLLDLMGGSITVRSQPGFGSEFQFRIPYTATDGLSENMTSLDTPLHQKPLAGIKILAAEDDPISAIMLQHNLEEDGATVIMTDNGQEAIEHIRKNGTHACDIVLMDVQMPAMNGYEATRRIHELVSGLPVIGQSSHVLGDEKGECFAAGMCDHVSKPIDFNALVDIILKHVTTDRAPH